MARNKLDVRKIRKMCLQLSFAIASSVLFYLWCAFDFESELDAVSKPEKYYSKRGK